MELEEETDSIPLIFSDDGCHAKHYINVELFKFLQFKKAFAHTILAKLYNFHLQCRKMTFYIYF